MTTTRMLDDLADAVARCFDSYRAPGKAPFPQPLPSTFDDNAMTMRSWAQLYVPPTMPSASAQAKRVVAEVTQDMQGCGLAQVANLYWRSAALTACCRSDLALHDALAMQAIAPCSMLGYMCAGSIYTDQGRQAQAIREYDKGLSCVPRSDPDYDLLEKAKAISEARQRTRIDFVRRLPLEVVLTVFKMVLDDEPMHMDYRCSCLDVSRTWRQRFLQTGSVRFVIDPQRFPDVHNDRRLAIAAPYISDLTWMDCRLPLQDVHERYPLSSIRRLYIEGAPLNSADRAVETLQAIGAALTHLKLDLTQSQRKRAVNVREVLDSCPSLVSLDCNRFDMDLTAATCHYPKLTFFKLRNARELIPYNVMVDALQRLPSLEVLAISTCRDARPLALLSTYCPKLRKVIYGQNEDLWDTSCVVWEPAVGLGGWEVLALGDIGVDYAVDNLVALASEHYTSLRTFFVSGDISEDAPDDSIKALFSNSSSNDRPITQFTHMRHLTIQSTDADPHELHVRLLEWMLRRSPALETLATQHILFDKHIVDAIMPTLTKVSIDADGDSHEDGEGVALMLNKLADTCCRLHTLRLVLSRGEPDGPILGTIPRLVHLQDLELDTCTEIMNDDHIPFIQELGKCCPRIERLILANEGGFSERFLFQIHQGFPAITYLRLWATRVPDAGLMSLLACPNLQRLEVWSTRIRPLLAEVLKEKIPHVSIPIPIPLSRYE